MREKRPSLPALRPKSSRRPVSEARRRETTESHPVPMAQIEAAAAASGREANIIVLAHPSERLLGHRFRLARGTEIEIGRGPDCGMSFPDVSSISRLHARLSHRERGVVLEDLGSTNGTYVNDRRIAGPTTLRSGDRFQVGVVHFKFLHELDVEAAYHHAIFDLATRDGLTEIFNKRKFDEELEREFSRARRYARSLSLVAIDADHFKAVNDHYGHLAGDAVLKQIALRVSSLLRSEQIFARVGGEEFAILCPETDEGGAASLAEKLRRTIAAEPFRFADVATGVTCSFGVAQMTEAMERPTDLCVAADRALYVSKGNGRNRVTPVPPDPLL
jgi:two-component system, cell cycle response regulator